jgi:sugar phosphate isomerase/epimerase
LLEREIREVLAPFKRENRISFSLHLPTMGGLDIASSIRGIRETAVDTYRKAVNLTLPLEPDTYVLHVAGMILEATNSMVSGSFAPALRRLLMENAFRSVEEILTYLPAESLCIENLPYFPIDFLEPFVRDFRLSVCLDVGHLTLIGASIEEFWGRFGPSTREVHLHDVKLVRQSPNVLLQVDHHALGEGDLDIGRILDILYAHVYAGPLVLETLHDAEMRSVAALKRMIEIRDASRS